MKNYNEIISKEIGVECNVEVHKKYISVAYDEVSKYAENKLKALVNANKRINKIEIDADEEFNDTVCYLWFA